MLLVCTHGGRGTRTGFTQADLETNTRFCPICRRKLDWSKASLPPEVLARFALPRGFDAASFVGGLFVAAGASIGFFLSPPGQAFLVSLRTALRISGRHAGGGFLDRVKAAFQRPAAPTEEKPLVVFRRMGSPQVSGHEVVSPAGQPIPHAHPGEFQFR